MKGCLNFGNAVAIDGGELKLNTHIDGGELGVFYNTGGTEDYNALINKPSINGVVLQGDKTSAELGIESDKFYVFTQMAPASQWNISHPLDKFPSITVVDSGGSVVIGDVLYIDNSNIIITFNSAFSGIAYLN